MKHHESDAYVLCLSGEFRVDAYANIAAPLDGIWVESMKKIDMASNGLIINIKTTEHC